MKRAIVILLLGFLLPIFSWGQTKEHAGLITRPSDHSVSKTVDLLKSAIEEMDLKVIAEIDHAEAAAKSGLQLRPTHTLLFGNPNVGTKLMQTDQRTGLDLPLRILVWEQEGGKVFITFHNPTQLAELNQLSGHQDVLQKMQGVLDTLVQKVKQTK